MQLMTTDLITEMKKNSHFTRKEAWGDINRVSAYLIMAGMIPYRALLDSPVIINNSFATSGHSTNSLHYRGLACDHHASKKSLYEQCKVASKVGFNAIGAYFDWHNMGLHTDMRGLVDMPDVYWINAANLKHPEGGNKKGDYYYYGDKAQWLYAVGLNENK